jgi:NTE family protein
VSVHELRIAEPAALGPESLDEHVLPHLQDEGWAPQPADVNRTPRIGMVFGAGGVLGNAYLSGAAVALWEAAEFQPRTASVLVGTSAGSVHAALYGAGLPAHFGLWRTRGGRLPDRVMGAAGGPDPGESQTLKDIFTPARALPRIGPQARGLALRSLLQPWRMRPEVMLTAWLPEGMFTNIAIGQALQRVVPSGWAPHPRTWITALNLRTGHRDVFGRMDAPRAHLDRAVRASCAIPGLYRPVKIGRDRYVDGGMHSPSNADLVADLDLDLVVIINPMSSLEGHAAAGFVDRYLYPLRRMAERRLAAELRVLSERDVPTLVIQPQARDLAVFSRNLMDSRPRRSVAETAVETTLELLERPEHDAALTTLRLAARRAASA